jgi:hypothetical protein
MVALVSSAGLSEGDLVVKSPEKASETNILLVGTVDGYLTVRRCDEAL